MHGEDQGVLVRAEVTEGVERPEGFAAVPVLVLDQEERTVVIGGPLGADERIAVTRVVALKAAWLGGVE